MKTMRRTRVFAIGMAMCALLPSFPVLAQEAESDELAELQEARLRLEQARQQLEEAAQEVARLSAERLGPQMHNVWIGRGVNVARPLLGLNIDESERGVRVVGVTPNGAAAQAGIRSGDTIVRIDEQGLDGPDGVQRLLRYMADVEIGDTVGLAVLRDGSEIDIDVEVREMLPGAIAFSGIGPLGLPGAPNMATIHHVPTFDVVRGNNYTSFVNPALLRGAWRSLELIELTPGLGDYFGTEQGILVVRAPDDESIGLTDGDVILEIGGRQPSSAEHAIRILASFEPGEELQLLIMRQQRRETLDIELR